MKNIKLIINNDIKKEKVKFFVKKELKCILNLRWVYFFFGLAILNEIIWRTYCPEQEYIWVNFKVWGILPITIIFTAFQISIINKYKLNE